MRFSFLLAYNMFVATFVIKYNIREFWRLEPAKVKYTYKDVYWRDLWLIPIVIVSLFLILNTSVIVASLFNIPFSNQLTVNLSVISQCLAYCVGFLGFYLLHYRGFFKKIKFYSQRAAKHWKRIIIVFVLMITSISLYTQLISLLPESLQFQETENQKTIESLFNVPAMIPILFTMIVIAGPIMEEMFFRYFLIGQLGKVFTFPVMSVISVLTFAAIHTTHAQSPFEYGLYLLLSIGMVYIYLKTGRNIMAAIALHIINNFVSFIMSLIAIGFS